MWFSEIQSWRLDIFAEYSFKRRRDTIFSSLGKTVQKFEKLILQQYKIIENLKTFSLNSFQVQILTIEIVLISAFYVPANLLYRLMRIKLLWLHITNRILFGGHERLEFLNRF